MTDRPEQVRANARLIVSQAIYVTVDGKKIDRFLEQHPWSEPPFPFERLYLGEPKLTATARLYEAAINFCFWPKPGELRWEFYDRQRGQWTGGYFGLLAALKQYFRQHPRLLEFPSYLSHLGRRDLESIFYGKGQLPLVIERLKAWHDLAKGLIVVNNSFTDLIESADRSAAKLVQLVARHLPYFHDLFLKRAQLLVADLWRCFDGQGLGEFNDIDQLTVFADYKLPQLLSHYRILVYRRALASKIRSHEYIEAYAREEVEIRAATVVVGDLIADRLKASGHSDVVPCLVDHWLWNIAQDMFLPNPHHLTITTCY